MKPDMLVSALLVSSGIYAWVYAKGHKDKIAPWLGYPKLVIFCTVMIVGGVLVAIAEVLGSRH